jgi:hypothetical protein
MKIKNFFFHAAVGYPQACYYSQDAEPDNGSIEVNGIRMGTALFLNNKQISVADPDPNPDPDLSDPCFWAF